MCDLLDDLDSPKEDDRRGLFSTAKAARDYLTAGHAVVTIRSVGTGTRMTFKLSRPDPKPGDKYAPPLFVSRLIGPENSSDYLYLGMIVDREPTVIRKTARSAYGHDTSIKAMEWVLRRLHANELPDTVEIWHEGRCGRCGRKLTVPSSIEFGIGPECARRMGE